ncbi:glycosyltransferase [Mycolicibacterium tokaiense]|uniref:glycosyltransferase n=1 Tax=Mycolicibacterium tokaiense TaxID=39695 RepID=UPI002350934C|nr:glycosyltransferase [Mycolicibacterium tokaiense]
MPAARPCKDRFSTIVALGSALACVGTVHQLFNRRLLRRPPADPAPHSDGVSVLVPARDEAHRIGPTVAALVAQQGPTRMEILVLDDNSTDGTAQVVTAAARSDPRVRVLAGTPPRREPSANRTPAPNWPRRHAFRRWCMSTPMWCCTRGPSPQPSTCCAEPHWIW